MSADMEKVRKLFEEYDFNKNGILDKDEFLTIFKKMLYDIGQYVPDKRHDEIAEEGMETFDLNRNGVIEFDEFYEVINFLVTEKGYALK